jgi:hypothetical protein
MSNGNSLGCRGVNLARRGEKDSMTVPMNRSIEPSVSLNRGAAEKRRWSLPRSLVLILILFATMGAPLSSHAQGSNTATYRDIPYGHFCPGSKGGGPYGTRRPVSTADEAKRMVETYLSQVGHVMRTGKIEEKKWHFEMEILDQDGKPTDAIIVDKRTGRIRSIY